MVASPLRRFIRNELVQHVKRPSFAAFLFLLSLLMLFEMSLPSQGSLPANPIKTLILPSLVFSNFISALFLTFLASSSLAREYEERTMNILLTAPLRRSKIFFGKMAALACLVPVIILFDLFYILSLSISYGALPDVELTLVPYELLVSALFLLSVIVLSMLLSVMMRSSSLVLISMTIFLFLSAFLGLPVLRTDAFQYSISYPSVFLMPASLMVSAFRITESYCIVDSALPALQVLFIALIIIAGAWLFRRSELWG